MANFDDLLSNTPDEPKQSAELTKEEYAAKKKNEREEAFALSDQTAMEVSADGILFQSFLDLQGRLDRYSAVNALLIFAKNQNASRVGSFDYWKNQGCSVKPGQTAISILEPHEYTKDDGTPGTGYNVKKVFDISQVDTRKLKSVPEPHYTERQLLAALISKAPVKIIGVDELPGDLGAMTDPDTGNISVRRGMKFDDTFRCAAQELAAADLTTGPDTQADPAFSSYCASYLLCKKYGVDGQSFSFENAPGVFDGMDSLEVKGELLQIRDVAEDISGRMARQLEVQSKAAKNQEAR
jgi:hypothetical protein